MLGMRPGCLQQAGILTYRLVYVASRFYGGGERTARGRWRSGGQVALGEGARARSIDLFAGGFPPPRAKGGGEICACAYALTCSPSQSIAACVPPLPCGMCSAAKAISMTLRVPRIIGALTCPI
jgi:hypothetical protein